MIGKLRSMRHNISRQTKMKRSITLSALCNRNTAGLMKIEMTKNVIKIDDWKKSQLISQKEQDLSDYLNVLSFHDLMHESTEIINEINNNDGISEDLSLKSQALADEIGDRIEHSSGGLSETFRNLKHNIEDTLHRLNKLL
jgi:hypothetical protein